MFERLFSRPAAVARHTNAPMRREREAFIQHEAARGISRNNLRQKANLLIAISSTLELPSRGTDIISSTEISAAARTWSTEKTRTRTGSPQSPTACRRFDTFARQWLDFLGRLEAPVVQQPPYFWMVEAYDKHSLDERGLSPATVTGQSSAACDFLEAVSVAGKCLRTTTVADIDKLLLRKVTERQLSRGSARVYATRLRSFLRFAEQQGWCTNGLSTGPRGARAYSQDRLPAGPAWADVERVLATTDEDHPTNVRDRAIILLLAMYGLRAKEVLELRIDDFDWEQELLKVRRSKPRDQRVYPLVGTVGNAVIDYVRRVRPTSPHREVFLTVTAPFRPMRGGLWRVVSSRMKPLGLNLQHHGPHALRHACATHLLEQGFSLKEIGDHLGHRSPEATRIYAKVDLDGLRRVAAFDLGELP